MCESQYIGFWHYRTRVFYLIGGQRVTKLIEQQKYEDAVAKIQQVLQCANSISVTSVMWTSQPACLYKSD